MSPLYLRCVICERQQADGLLSRAAWGRLDPAPQYAEHPALSGTVWRACPTCVTQHEDWQSRMLVVLGVVDTDGASPATA
jgi:hypothetical protein